MNQNLKSFSVLAHEALFHSAVLGVRSVFTDHSLFGFADLSSILTNNVLKFSLNGINHVICVSNTARENTVLRSNLNAKDVSVIPNAIDASQFQPDLSRRNRNKIVIVVMSRLVYRRGTDLLTSIIPYICDKYPQVDFLIGGDGDKRILLEEIREQHSLHSRVELLGMVQHELVRDVMVRGNIFVNTSLTESFCITIVEAASCGLKVVTTDVGGIPEVLPPNMVKLAKPTPESLTEALESAIAEEMNGLGLSPLEQHDKLKDIYKWSEVARRTEIVYNGIFKQSVITPKHRMDRLWHLGIVFGKIWIMALVLDMIFCKFLEWWRPASYIDKTSTQTLARLSESSCNAGEGSQKTLDVNHGSPSRGSLRVRQRSKAIDRITT
ncbi:phosphatidylinositol N-acetylglucosaminyltransferase subunit A-like isoform X2 [Watersipora subatra]|uniref:phosphatidylinositol N-acetylglucosaminyltransferase subunit A-like isoform X2 n=1 Tax=Watersipora subatra TaxID=2589382 RepID=UPI00355C205F